MVFEGGKIINLNTGNQGGLVNSWLEWGCLKGLKLPPSQVLNTPFNAKAIYTLSKPQECNYFQKSSKPRHVVFIR